MMSAKDIIKISKDKDDMLHHVRLSDLMIDFNIPYFCLRCDRGVSLDISYIHKRIGGCSISMGLRGNYFMDPEIKDFKGVMSNLTWIDLYQASVNDKGDSLRRFLFKQTEVDKLIDVLKIYIFNFNSNKSSIKNLIEKTRKSYCSDNPDAERMAGLYVELNEIFGK